MGSEIALDTSRPLGPTLSGIGRCGTPGAAAAAAVAWVRHRQHPVWLAGCHRGASADPKAKVAPPRRPMHSLRVRSSRDSGSVSRMWHASWFGGDHVKRRLFAIATIASLLVSFGAAALLVRTLGC